MFSVPAVAKRCLSRYRAGLAQSRGQPDPADVPLSDKIWDDRYELRLGPKNGFRHLTFSARHAHQIKDPGALNQISRGKPSRIG
jgi:hypothetical protein